MHNALREVEFTELLLQGRRLREREKDARLILGDSSPLTVELKTAADRYFAEYRARFTVRAATA